MMEKIKRGEERCIIGVYVRKEELEEKLEELEEWTNESKDKRNVIIGEDFNTRTGKKGGKIEEGENWESEIEGSRKSKDKKMDREGRRLVYGEEGVRDIQWKYKRGCRIYIYGGNGNMVIDYII